MTTLYIHIYAAFTCWLEYVRRGLQEDCCAETIRWRSTSPSLAVAKSTSTRIHRRQLTLSGIIGIVCLLLPSLAQAQCSLTVTPKVSGCYSISGVSKATVSVEVAWTNAPAGQYIVVTTGTQSRTITPGLVTITYPQVVGTLTGQTTIVSPQVVAFEIDANSTASTIVARFNATTSCQATHSFTAPAPCLPTACSGTGLGGMLFSDFNDNGSQEVGETAGIPGATVQAIACDGTVYSTVTDPYGRYTLPVPTGKYPVRVEFTSIPTVYNPGVNGADSRTSVQFVQAPACDINLGVSNPADYCSNTPDVFVPCYVYGDPLIAGSSSANSAALVSIPYGVSSMTFQGEKELALASKIGTVWGSAYNKLTKRLFLSAVLKRHAGLGPAGLGGLYVTDYTNPSAPVTSTFLSVSTIGINVGSIASNAARGLLGDKTLASRDAQSFSVTAKVGIGDLEISEDGNKLWLMNLSDKKLYSIDITQYNLDGVTKPTAANVSAYVVPSSCVDGQFRPWALKVYNGKVYVGGVCDAQVSGDKSDLRASVYELNGSTFTQIFDFPLTYPKGYPAAANRNITGWFPWTDTFNDLLDGSSTTLRHPVPIFTDIEFDIDGSMVLAFGDRTGFQGGDQNYRPDGTSSTLYETNSQAGDILRAYYSNGTFVLENNAKAGPTTGYGAKNAQGPGFGEFYNDNWIQEGGTNVIYHAEEIMGGLALKPGTGEVVVTVIDPLDAHPFAGGVRYMNNTTGKVTGAYSVYITREPGGTQTPGTFAKATGLGDIELSCNTITLLEIGSRVWRDDDLDGIQDACEPPLAGIRVSLYNNGTLIATTTTTAEGEYFFTNNPVSSSVTGVASSTAIKPGTAYQLVFGTNQFANNKLTLNGNQYGLTQANSTTATANDLNDSDAILATVAGITAPVISLTTGDVGIANHTYDVGFYQLARLGDYVFEDVNANGQQDAGIDKPIAGVVVTLMSNGTVVATTTTNGSGLYSFTGLTPGKPYSVSFTAPGGFSATFQNTGNDVTDSDGNLATGLTSVYSLTAGENNPTVDMGYYKPASLGDYVFADTNRNGQQDAGDTPIAGVVVTLMSNGTVVATTTTNGSGLYSFTGLTPGKPYSVSFTTPTGYTATTPNTGNDATDSDPVNGLSAPVTLTSGENNTTLDAGFFTCPSVNVLLTATPAICVGQSATLVASGASTYAFSTTGATGSTVVVYPVTTTIYSVSGVNSFGCTGVASATVTVDPLPVATLSSATICTGGSATLVATGGSFYRFSTGGAASATTAVPVSPSTTTPYSVTVTSASGCSAMATATVRVNPLPTATLSSATLCAGQATTLTASGGSFYRFSTGEPASGSSTLLVRPTSTTTYTVTVTNGSGCSATAVSTVTVNPSPTATLSSATVCPGQTATLVAGGGQLYQFAPGAAAGTGNTLVVAPLMTTPYTVTVTNASGCTALATGTLVVTTQPVATFSSATICTGQTATLTAGGGSTYQFAAGDLPSPIATRVVSPTATTTYTVTAIAGSGCVGVATATVTVNPLPAITLSSATLCAGGSATLTASGASTYYFSTGNATGNTVVVQPTASTTYSVTGITSSGCWSTATATVGVNPQSVLSVIGTNCNGTTTYTVNFTATAGSLINTSAGTLRGNQVLNVPSAASLTLTAGMGSCIATVTVSRDCASNIAGLGDYVFLDANQDGIQNAGDTPIRGVLVALYTNSVLSATTTTNASGFYSFTGLTPGNSLSYSVGFSRPTGYTATGANQGTDDSTDSDASPLTGRTQAVTLAAGEFNATLDAGYFPLRPNLSITKRVTASRAEIGDLLTYTLLLSNTGEVPAPMVTVRDSAAAGLTYLTGSATAPIGSTFTPGAPVSLWTVGLLSAGQSVSMTYQTEVNKAGILYNTATVSGETAQACTTVPIHICEGQPFQFDLTAPGSAETYQWSRNGQPIAGATSRVYSVTSVGEYTVATLRSSACPDGSCCPFIVVADPAPSLTALAIGASCVGSQPQANAKITLISSSSSAVSYNIARGANFSTTTSVFSTLQPLSAVVSGVLLDNEPNPAQAAGSSYTIRVYATTGCYNDVVVVIPPSLCTCPATPCVPFVIKKTKTGGKLIAP
ncbi:SdrD B-like domain-containing protein [uncultured Fibrella sp.]|uniref:SdrD B-like domain-containing protein n=1 Tax=uncultured Fibrella sp. TaxID=1284596 RepID=UPI0035CB3AEC